MTVVTNRQEEEALPSEFTEWFSDWKEAVTYIGLQHSAVAQVDAIERLVHAGIALPIDVSQIKSLEIHALEMLFLYQISLLKSSGNICIRCRL